MSQPASLIGFDDVRFGVRASDDAGIYPDWSFAPVIVSRHIAGTNSAYVQHMGTPPATLTLRLFFDDVPTYRRLVARLTTTGALTLLANATSAVGVVWHEHGRDYERYDAVLLAQIANTQIAVDGTVECDATFSRAMNPATGRAVAT